GIAHARLAIADGKRGRGRADHRGPLQDREPHRALVDGAAAAAHLRRQRHVLRAGAEGGGGLAGRGGGGGGAHGQRAIDRLEGVVGGRQGADIDVDGVVAGGAAGRGGGGQRGRAADHAGGVAVDEAGDAIGEGRVGDAIGARLVVGRDRQG